MLNVDTTQPNYILYARKSSESEDRQVQSLDDQVTRLKQLAQDLGLRIADICTEAKSAKKPNNRPLFDQVMTRIEKGEADGILCWQINRLSRNPIDSARVQWLLQQGIIKSIQTIDKVYRPEDNVLLFSVESGIANQFVIDLRKNVIRGLQSRLSKGWLPNMAPLGYLNDKNDKEEKTIVKDPQRFHLVRKMWDLMLTGGYTPPQILERANNQWGLRTRQFKRTGGNPLARSSIYRLFTNLFYTGIIDYSGKHHPGNHDPMITFAEYDRVQFLLGRKGAPRRKRHAFAFTGFIRCGECGCSITAQVKTKYIKSEGETRCYTYYHCTRKRKDIVCSQRRYIREEELERQIAEEIGKYTILPEFRDWGLEILDSAHNREVEERSKVYETQHQTLVATQNQLDNLVRMKYKEMVTDEEYHRERNRLEGDIARLKAELRQTENRAQDWVKLTEQVFNFVTHAQKAFQKGDLQTKKAILMTLGQNPTIKDGKLSLEANCWLKPIEKDYPPLEAEYRRLEPLKTRINKGKNEVKTSLCPRWRCVVDDVRTAIMAEEGQIYIPDVRPMRLKADDMMNLPHTL